MATLRNLSETLKLSISTISSALRNSPVVKPETAERVRAAAAAAGYQLNPLAGAVMSEVRKARVHKFRGCIAIVDTSEVDRPANSLGFHSLMFEEAVLRGQALNFKVERFVLNKGGLTLRRLGSILVSRGVQGVMVLPGWRVPDLSGLDWSRYAGIYMDYGLKQPKLHAVVVDHYGTLIDALQRLESLGYARPGFVIEKPRDDRLQNRWSGAFLAHQHNLPPQTRVPPLYCEKIERRAFVRWFRSHRPDVVIGHDIMLMRWMEECGAKIPDTHGFLSLNVQDQPERCAGIDLQPRLLGLSGVDVLVSHIYRSEAGVPKTSLLTVVPGRFHEGTTIRSMR